MPERTPAFSAVSTSARQLYQLLRCIAFATHAKVQITSAGIRFTVDETRVVQGLAFVESSLFSSYNLKSRSNDGGNDDSANTSISLPTFQISITALLETLQIFGLSDTTSSTTYRHQNGGFVSSSYANAFSTPALALGGTCRITYAEPGSPLSVTIQEGGVTTSCNINTYDLGSIHDDSDDDDPTAGGGDGIPLDRNALCLKVIMRSTWLHDAIAELSGTNSTTLVISASERLRPFFALEGQGGPFGDCTVEYEPESKNEPNPLSVTKSKRQPAVTETFSVAAPSGSGGRVKQKYKFDLIKKAGRAMAVANKVSIRMDRQGCLSLQFMIELSESGIAAAKEERAGTLGSVLGTTNSPSNAIVSFVDFRFVPLVDDSDDDDDDDQQTESEEDEAEHPDNANGGAGSEDELRRSNMIKYDPCKLNCKLPAVAVASEQRPIDADIVRRHIQKPRETMTIDPHMYYAIPGNVNKHQSLLVQRGVNKQQQQQQQQLIQRAMVAEDQEVVLGFSNRATWRRAGDRVASTGRVGSTGLLCERDVECCGRLFWDNDDSAFGWDDWTLGWSLEGGVE